ncbi:hypothetical protein G7054_g4661 [Neopestalotiopsis clavispora]|nr:hypothetical protein G7054_g4661 [Neopestalotiopsis clavispora]
MLSTKFLALVALAFAANVLGAGDNTTSKQNGLLNDKLVDFGTAQDAYEKAKAFVAPLNTTEKIAIVMASDFSNNNASWTAYAITDGVSGLNMYYQVSAFPLANALIQTWNRDLIAAQFKAVGEEFFNSGFNVLTSRLGGRQNEAFSPDPYLSGIAVAEAVKGQQEAGVVSTVRHFILYEQETNRTAGSGTLSTAEIEAYATEYNLTATQLESFESLTDQSTVTEEDISEILGSSASESTISAIESLLASYTSASVYSSNADDKTLHELYMWPWADAVRAGAGAVMCSMNLVNGTHACENEDLMAGKLKTELGFPGFVFPDANAQTTAYASANAGLDYSTLGYWTQETLSAGIANGSITAERLEDMAIRTVLPYFLVGLDTSDLPSQGSYTSWRDVRGDHDVLIRQVGGEAISLLKNNIENGPNFGFSVQGTDADIFEGHLACGGGSGETSFPYLITPYEAIQQRAIKDKSMIFWILNNTYTSGSISSFGAGTAVTPSYANYASQSEVCLVFRTKQINSWSGEGADRSELSNDVQDNLVLEVASNCNNTIVVVNTSGPRILEAWIENENITAVVYTGLLGQESGNAIADVLYGDVNPSGKLAHTIAKNATDYPASICADSECPFTEGVLIDYRWFDAQEIEPRYPFGHGLSYTVFSYGTLAVEVKDQAALLSKYPTAQMTLGGRSDLFDEVVSVSIDIQNSGTVDGAEVAQLYVNFPDEAAQSPRVLRGFEKVSLACGESALATFSLRRRDLSYWDSVKQDWVIASGEYTFSVGSSSRDLRANTTLTV